MKKTLLFTSITFIIISCSTNLNFQQSTIEEPAKNILIRKKINENIYYYENLRYRPAVKITEIPKDNDFFQGNYPFTVGDVIPLTKETKKLNIYTFKKEYIKHSNGGMILSDKAKKFGNFGIGITKENKAYPIYAITNSPAIEEKEGIKIIPAKYTNINCDNCFVKELTYKGQEENKLKFHYKEYTRDLAFPTVQKDTIFDVTNNSILIYKGIKIKILNSNNNYIEYNIL